MAANLAACWAARMAVKSVALWDGSMADWKVVAMALPWVGCLAALKAALKAVQKVLQ